MIALASDYVGFKIVSYLVDRKEAIDFLVLSRSNPRGYNEKIAHLVESLPTEIVFDEELYSDSFLEKLKKKSCSLGLLLWWPKIIKEPLLAATKNGWVNCHPSFLPYCRGKHPNFWCLVEGVPCGVSIHYANRNVDEGALIAQKEIVADWTDTGKTIYEKSRDEIVSLFTENFEQIKAGSARGVVQDLDSGSYHHSSEIALASKIELDKKYTARELLNIVRAKMFEPYPSAWFEDNGRKYSVKVLIEACDEE